MVAEFGLLCMDKVLMPRCLQPLQAVLHCSLAVAESSPLGKCLHTNAFHSPPESLQLSVCYWHCPGLFLQALGLLFVQKSAGNVQQVQ